MIRLCSGVDYGPLGRCASEWIIESGRGRGGGPVTKVERRRLPERSFVQDPDGPSPAISFGRPTVCAGYIPLVRVGGGGTGFLLREEFLGE